jgi:hypothetical protein
MFLGVFDGYRTTMATVTALLPPMQQMQRIATERQQPEQNQG